MKTKKLRHLLTATAVLFSMMLALPRQAQAQNTVTIDGVKKNILSTEFTYGYGDADAFAAYLYLSSDKKEYVKIMATKSCMPPTSTSPSPRTSRSTMSSGIGVWITRTAMETSCSSPGQTPRRGGVSSAAACCA